METGALKHEWFEQLHEPQFVSGVQLDDPTRPPNALCLPCVVATNLFNAEVGAVCVAVANGQMNTLIGAFPVFSLGLRAQIRYHEVIEKTKNKKFSSPSTVRVLAITVGTMIVATMIPITATAIGIRVEVLNMAILTAITIIAMIDFVMKLLTTHANPPPGGSMVSERCRRPPARDVSPSQWHKPPGQYLGHVASVATLVGSEQRGARLSSGNHQI